MLFPFMFANAVIMFKKKQHFIKDMLFFYFMNVIEKNNIQTYKAVKSCLSCSFSGYHSFLLFYLLVSLFQLLYNPL